MRPFFVARHDPLSNRLPRTLRRAVLHRETDPRNSPRRCKSIGPSMLEAEPPNWEHGCSCFAVECQAFALDRPLSVLGRQGSERNCPIPKHDPSPISMYAAPSGITRTDQFCWLDSLPAVCCVHGASKPSAKITSFSNAPISPRKPW